MNDCELIQATAADFPSLSRLWGEVFGDGEDFILAFFRGMWHDGCCRAYRTGGDIAAMGCCLDGPTANGYRCSYIYAMATAGVHRGRGLAERIGRALISDAFARGSGIVATLPAEESLNAWYETRLGMVPAFKKGGAGVLFPEHWRRFAAAYCPEHDPNTPGTLLAVAREGVDLKAVSGLGWEYTLD
ncbi:MAG TPA: GNAT family N-acetyltransferase [Candidatus Scatomorpha merdigallinarum]|nr:GNAT family N-acetyltransferase [Candidatus Scatomorpha merdigallinarum]